MDIQHINQCQKNSNHIISYNALHFDMQHFYCWRIYTKYVYTYMYIYIHSRVRMYVYMCACLPVYDISVGADSMRFLGVDVAGRIRKGVLPA